MIRNGLLAPAVVLLVLGGDGVVRAARNRQQTIVDCRTYVDAPSAAWVRVTGCEIDVAGAGYRERGGTIDELYFPARPPRSGRAAAPLVVAVRHPSALAQARRSMIGGTQPDPSEYSAAMRSVIVALGIDGRIEGCARLGLLDRFGARTILAGLNASPNAVVIDLHAEPDWIVPSLLAIAGTVLAGAAILATRGRQRRAGPARPPTARRRLLILNLGPDADVDAIEKAPPLGARRTVVNGIADLLPDVSIDAQGRGAAGGTDGLVIDIGPDEIVYTATVTVFGSTGAERLRALLRTTGWRAFEPKTGAFVEEAALR